VTQASSRRTGRSNRSGRRGGDSGTREAILAAARARFGDLGYDRTTIRGIAADAGVDPALVHHFYGTKESLFAAAMRLPLNPGDVVDAVLKAAPDDQGQELGEHLMRTLLGIWRRYGPRSWECCARRSPASRRRACCASSSPA